MTRGTPNSNMSTNPKYNGRGAPTLPPPPRKKGVKQFRPYTMVDKSYAPNTAQWEPYEDEFPNVPFNKSRWITSSFRQWIKFRWMLRYPLQKRVYRSLTVGEVFILIPLTLAYFTMGILFFVDRTLFGTGYIAGFPFFVTFAAVGHNSLFMFLAGIPFERCITYHRFAAYLGIILGTMHGVQYEIEEFDFGQQGSFFDDDDQFYRITGWLLLGSVYLIFLTSLWWFRRKLFEFFYRFHIFIILIIFVFALMHQAIFGIIGGVFWIADVAYRLLTAMCYHPKVARFTVEPGEIVKVAIKKGSFHYKGGQYIFICVPGLSPFQWHPFSISSSPNDEFVTVHIRVLGDWTKALYKLVAKSRGQSVDMNVLFEGPYGGVTLNIDDNTYQHILMVSGGIGVTPMLSIANSLREQADRGRPLQRVHNLWTIRDRHMVKTMMDDKNDTKENREIMLSVKQLPLSFRPDMLRLAQSELDDSKDPVFKTELYLTKLDHGEAMIVYNSVDPKIRPWLQKERPNIKEIFRKVKAKATEGTGDFYTRKHVRVAVLTCGPAVMVDLCEKLSASESDKNVTFDFHKETFEF